MQELDDQRLLEEFARRASETAFAALVGRYVNLVYSTAWRCTRNREHAEEITQAVFIILARKAGQLRHETVLSGWLYQAARLTSANFVRGEIRRQRHEQEAFMQSTLNESDAATAWKEIAPLLDEAMGVLNPTDRATVVLRYFEKKSAQEIASALKLSPDAAHKRVHRALEKLRGFFAKRGVHSSATLIAGAISVHSIQPAPAGLAQTVALAAAKGSAGASTFTLVKGVLKIMAWSQAKTAVIAVATVMAATLATTVTVEKVHEAENEKWQLADLGGPMLKTPPFRVVILPTKSHLRKPGRGIGGLVTDAEGMSCGVNQTISEMMRVAFSEYGAMIPPDRLIFNTPERTNRYDFIDNLRTTPREGLQRELQRKLGVIGHFETIETNVLFLRVQDRNPPDLKPARNTNAPSSLSNGNGRVIGRGQTITSLASALEETYLKIPVINQTGLSGQYDFKINWQPGADNEELKQALVDQLGLELVPGTAPVQMLVVSRAP